MLTKIFRQAGESDIVVNAHKINQGEPIVLDNKSMDFFFLKRQDPNVIISIAITLVQQKMPKYVHAKPYDIQVLTPMRKGLLGVERLNMENGFSVKVIKLCRLKIIINWNGKYLQNME